VSESGLPRQISSLPLAALLAFVTVILTLSVPVTAAAGDAKNFGSLFSYANPISLSADGASTSQILVTVTDAKGNARVGDHVHFSVGVQSGTGTCGTLDRSEVTTDHNGYATVTYTASEYDVACWVAALDGRDGQAARCMIYQGNTQTNAAILTANIPSWLVPGGPPTTFTVSAQNPSDQPVHNARLDFEIYGEPRIRNVDLGQIHLSYSTTGPVGAFTDVDLEGPLSNRGVEFAVGPEQNVEPNSAQTYTFQVWLDASVRAAAGPLMAFAVSLDQINSASGSGATLAQSSSYDIVAPNASAPTGNTLRNALPYIAAAVILLAIVLDAFLQSRHDITHKRLLTKATVAAVDQAEKPRRK
jgi:hypothetical protein